MMVWVFFVLFIMINYKTLKNMRETNLKITAEHLEKTQRTSLLRI